MKKNKYDIEPFIKGDLTLQQIWDESKGECSEETRSDFYSIGEKICSYEKKKATYRHILITVTSVAACIALCIGTLLFINGRKEAEYVQVIAPKGQILSVSLPDSSSAVLQSGATLTYPSKFLGRKRTVFLTGLANFSVARNARKPFIVRTQYMDIEALGTKFCVMAYPNGYSVSATLMEGSIKVDVKSDTLRSFIIKPNSQIKYIPSDNDIQVLDIDAEKLASWENGNSVFQNSTFLDVINEIERRYDVVIDYDAKFRSANAFFLKLYPEDSLSDALDMVTSLIGNAEYDISGRKVFIRSTSEK